MMKCRKEVKGNGSIYLVQPVRMVDEEVEVVVFRYIKFQSFI